MRLGLEAVGGVCVASCERDKFARQTYAANFPTEGHPFYWDIRDLTATDQQIRAIPDHDIFVAGFPCQPFSIAGVSKRNAMGRSHGFACEVQGTLFFDLARILQIKKPSAFILENVKNLVGHDKGRTFRTIMKVLREDLRYAFVEHRIIDAKGIVPQHRERTFIVGFAEDRGFDWEDVQIPDPTQGPKMKSILHSPHEPPEDPYTRGQPCRVNPKYVLSQRLWNWVRQYAAKHQAAGNRFGFGMVGPDDTARTLSARYYKDGSEILVRRSANGRPRRLTPRECSRLTGFDKKGYTPFTIPVSDMQAYRQFGNAVVPSVVEGIARAMIPFVIRGLA